ncbi:MAG: ABC transporter substrate-binding protein [Anaerolineae bacterium]
MCANQGEGAGTSPGGCWGRRLVLCCAVLTILLGSLLATCTPKEGTGPRPTPLATIAPGATPAATNSPVAQANISPTASLTITVWGPEFLAPSDQVAGGSVLAEQFRAFGEAHPGWAVDYVRKKPYGPGGLVHFLKATHLVAPNQLPDLIVLDMRELGLLTDEQLLQPVEPLLGTGVMADLVPFARTAGTVGDHLLAAQYAADLCFLAYNSEQVERPPATWAEVLAQRVTYLLPMGASEGAVRDAFLPQYLALGGRLVDRNGAPYLDSTLVAAILEVYASARASGLLPDSGLQLRDASDCWPVYLARQYALTNVRSWDYGRERAGGSGAIRPAALPTLSGTQLSMSSGWGFALVTKDASRQAACAELLRVLFEPQAMAAWSRATHHLPTRRAALALAVSDAEYLGFLQRLLEVTVPQPREPVYSLAVDALSEAVAGVSSGNLEPVAAAELAADKVRAARDGLSLEMQP